MAWISESNISFTLCCSDESYDSKNVINGRAKDCLEMREHSFHFGKARKINLLNVLLHNFISGRHLHRVVASINSR